MSVRPRRSFLTPFVVTLAAAPACFVQSSTPPSQPVVQTDPGQPTETDPRPVQPPTQAPTIIANPPRPQSQPEPPPPTAQETPPVAINSNPPPPDLPGNNEAWMITKSSQTCRAQRMNNNSCPPGVMCNPPPPRPTACIDDEKYPVKVIRHGEVCQVDKDPQPPCPKNAKCKPDPHVVPCP